MGKISHVLGTLITTVCKIMCFPSYSPGVTSVYRRRAGLSATAGLSCLSLTVNISKTVADTAKVTIND